MQILSYDIKYTPVLAAQLIEEAGYDCLLLSTLVRLFERLMLFCNYQPLTFLNNKLVVAGLVYMSAVNLGLRQQYDKTNSPIELLK